jgi:RNA polymerase sigma factor (sigma-70 family)
MSSDLLPRPAKNSDLRSISWHTAQNELVCRPLDAVLFDDEYLNRLRMRDPQTEEHFYAYFRLSIRTFMRARFRRWEDADDLTQQVFLAALEKIDGGAPREASKLPGYMRGISDNVAHDFIRKNRRYQAIDYDFDQLSGSEISAEKALITRQLIERMHNATEKLKPREQEALERELAGQSREAIAVKLGVSGAHLRLILLRARERVRSVLKSSKLP